MDNKKKKILAGVGTLILFLIGGFFYLSSPDDNAKEPGDRDEQAYNDEYKEESLSTENIEPTEPVSEASELTELTESTESTIPEEYAETYEFRKQQYLDEHFAKHGEEFDYETAEEYLAGANRVINDPNSLYKTEAEDGDHVYYLESTNEFVVVSTDGYIRTYFKPSAGIDYFNRQ